MYTYIYILDRGCGAHSGLVCVATWNCHRITPESSSVLRMACHRITSRVFALLTHSLVSRYSQKVWIAEPRTPTVKLNWAVVQVVPCLFDAHLIYSRCRAYLVSFRHFCPVPSLGTSQPPWTSQNAPRRHLWSPLALYTRERRISWLTCWIRPHPAGPWETLVFGNWQKCDLVSGHGLCHHGHGLAMNWVERPRTSADEWDVVWALRCRDCVWAVAGFGRFFIDLSFLREQSPWSFSGLAAALQHRCFPSNLSTTTQGAIVKLRGASSELCTLFIWSV